MIIKFLVWFGSFFILLFILFSLGETNEERVYESSYVGEKILYNSGLLEEDFINIEKIIQNENNIGSGITNTGIKNPIKETLLNGDSQIKTLYYPDGIEKYFLLSQKGDNLSKILLSKIFQEKNLAFQMELYKSPSNVRGKYTKNTIQLFHVIQMSKIEFISVFIHELGHYFDIKQLEKKVFFDVSDHFYSISWENTKILRAGSQQKDFVSGYAMSNKYEDFAETFTYYILYNDDFRKKIQTSKVLKKKYDFFSQYVFRNDEFKKTNFRASEEITDYCRDITKIDFLLKNFLEYLEKGV